MSRDISGITQSHLEKVYLLKVNNRSRRKRSKICSYLTIKTPRSGVFIINFWALFHIFSGAFIVDFELVIGRQPDFLVLNKNWTMMKFSFIQHGIFFEEAVSLVIHLNVLLSKIGRGISCLGSWKQSLVKAQSLSRRGVF